MVVYILSELLAVSIKFFHPTARALGSTNLIDLCFAPARVKLKHYEPPVLEVRVLAVGLP